MLIPGLVSATFKKESADFVLALAKEAGLSAIEWSEGPHALLDDEVAMSELGEKTREQELSVAALGSYYRLGEGMDFTPRIKAARALGAPLVRIWAGVKGALETDKDERRALVKEAREIAKRAEGLVVATEWHKNTLTDLNESGLRFLEEVDMPNFKTLWQPTQALSVDERVKGLVLIGNRLANLHVYYWDESGRRPLEEGEGHWMRYFEVASKEEDHYALLEFVMGDSKEQFISDAKTLLRWLGE